MRPIATRVACSVVCVSDLCWTYRRVVQNGWAGLSGMMLTPPHQQWQTFNRWKPNPAESLQSHSRRRLTNKTVLNLSAQRIIRKSKYQTLHSTGRLASKFARFVFDWKHLERYGCSCLCHAAQSRRHLRHSNVVFGNLGDQFLCSLWKISSVRCLTDWRQSSEIK